MGTAQSTSTLLAVGDVAPHRDNPASIFDCVRDRLTRADLTFCQLEIALSDKGFALPQARLAMRAKPGTAEALAGAGFDVVSFASNHCMDWGPEALLDTVRVLEDQRIRVIGAGANIAEAREPAVMDLNGTKVAVLAYNSILPQGYWADEDRAGCAPLRGLTLYQQVEHDQPGTPPKIRTFADPDDQAAMVGDIRRAKEAADVVVLSLHWGIHFVPAVIADYQKELARTAIDNGADLILGHHAHILKGAEVYRGKVIFYSLCNFALDLRATEKLLSSKRHQEIQVLNPSWQPDPEYPTYYLPPDARKTMVVKAEITDRSIERVSFLPTMVNKKSQPEILTSGEPGFAEVVAYMEEITKDQELHGAYTVDGDEVLVHEP